ncbi:MAG: hypothetical protein VX519_06600 [Myxococcota bacterium]|nr:hypothetical protein [Myxococcota bacterium]
MSEQMTSTIALKHEHGVSFGTVDWFNGEKLQCQVAAKISKGSVVEMRMELSGWKYTVYARVEIVSVGQGSQAATPRYGLKIRDISEEDQSRLEAWQKEQGLGGTTDDPLAQISDEMDDPFAVKQGAASEAETKLVMARYEERRRRLYRDDDDPDPFGLETESDAKNPSHSSKSIGTSTGSLAEGASPGWLSAMEKDAAQASGRDWAPREEEGITYETSHQVQGGGKRLAKGPAPDWLAKMEKETATRTGRDWKQREGMPNEPPPPVVTRPATPNLPTQPSKPTQPEPPQAIDAVMAEPASRSEWSVVEESVHVTWDSQEAYTQDWKTQLQKSVLLPPTGFELPSGNKIRVQLQLPDGQDLALRGSVDGSGAIQFNFSFPLRNKLKKAAG